MNALIPGSARSGKSRYAEKRALQSGLEVVYIATAGNWWLALLLILALVAATVVWAPGFNGLVLLSVLVLALSIAH